MLQWPKLYWEQKQNRFVSCFRVCHPHDYCSKPPACAVFEKVMSSVVCICSRGGVSHPTLIHPWPKPWDTQHTHHTWPTPDLHPSLVMAMGRPKDPCSCSFQCPWEPQHPVPTPGTVLTPPLQEPKHPAPAPATVLTLTLQEPQHPVPCSCHCPYPNPTRTTTPCSCS